MMPHLLNSNNLCTSLKDYKTEFANRTKSVSEWIFELYVYQKKYASISLVLVSESTGV